MDGSAATARAFAVEITELERLAAVQADARMEHDRTGAGPFRMRMRVADFGAVRLQSLSVTNSYVARGEIMGDRYGLLMPTVAPSGATLLNGFAATADDILLGRPGAELLGHAQAGQAWATLSLDGAAYGALLEQAWDGPGGTVMLAGALGAVPELRDLALEVAAIAAADPARLVCPPVAGALAEAFGAHLEALIRAAPSRPDRTGLRHLRAVSRAVEFLDTVLARPVYSEEVGQALGLSPRALNEAFSAVLEMSLHRYLRIRRLNLARRRLGAPGEAALVKTVALDLGFWHLGRFAQAYRDLFGETPSETLAHRAGRAG